MKHAMKIAAVAVLVAVGTSTAAHATYPVIDVASIAKLAEQMGQLKKQFEELQKQTEVITDVKKEVQDQLDAIGRMGQLSIPSLNLDTLTQDVLRNVQCLKPDLSGLMPSLSTEDLRFGTICQGRDIYKTALWLDPEAVAKTITWEEKATARKAVEARREALIKEISSSGLAQGDLAAGQQAETNQRATEELEQAASAAETQNDRLAVIAQSGILTNRQLVQQNQLLAQLVKTQSAMLMAMTVPVQAATLEEPAPNRASAEQ